MTTIDENEEARPKPGSVRRHPGVGGRMRVGKTRIWVSGSLFADDGHLEDDVHIGMQMQGHFVLAGDPERPLR